jgi:RimJ/RimL family protein N-acetyltransferase
MSIDITPISLEHAPRIQELASDPAITATTTLPEPYPEDGARQFIETTLKQREERKQFVFTIMADGEPVGVCGLDDCTDNSAELGYWVGKPYWGKGYATQACGKLVAYAFSERGFGQINSNCLLENRASYRVLEKLGFHLTGVNRIEDGKWPGSLIAFFTYRRLMWEVGQGHRYSA